MIFGGRRDSIMGNGRGIIKRGEEGVMREGSLLSRIFSSQPFFLFGPRPP